MELKYEPVMDAQVRPHGGIIKFCDADQDKVEGWCHSRCIVVPVKDVNDGYQ